MYDWMNHIPLRPVLDDATNLLLQLGQEPYTRADVIAAFRRVRNFDLVAFRAQLEAHVTGCRSASADASIAKKLRTGEAADIPPLLAEVDLLLLRIDDIRAVAETDGEDLAHHHQVILDSDVESANWSVAVHAIWEALASLREARVDPVAYGMPATLYTDGEALLRKLLGERSEALLATDRLRVSSKKTRELKPRIVQQIETFKIRRAIVVRELGLDLPPVQVTYSRSAAADRPGADPDDLGDDLPPATPGAPDEADGGTGLS